MNNLHNLAPGITPIRTSQSCTLSILLTFNNTKCPTNSNPIGLSKKTPSKSTIYKLSQRSSQLKDPTVRQNHKNVTRIS